MELSFLLAEPTSALPFNLEEKNFRSQAAAVVTTGWVDYFTTGRIPLPCLYSLCIVCGKRKIRIHVFMEKVTVLSVMLNKACLRANPAALERTLSCMWAYQHGHWGFFLGRKLSDRCNVAIIYPQIYNTLLFNTVIIYSCPYKAIAELILYTTAYISCMFSSVNVEKRLITVMSLQDLVAFKGETDWNSHQAETTRI